MIITDGIHLTSTTSKLELFSFAKSVGLLIDWYQISKTRHPHFDVTTNTMRVKVLAHSEVTKVPSRILVKACWAATDRSLYLPADVIIGCNRCKVELVKINDDISCDVQNKENGLFTVEYADIEGLQDFWKTYRPKGTY
jgi:hypothetical protein